MELARDPNTEILIKFDDVDSFKVLINLINDIFNSQSLFWIFNDKFVKFHDRIDNKKTDNYLDIDCRFKTHKLTKYKFKSKFDIYVLQLELNKLIKSIKNYNSKKGDTITISRNKKTIKIYKNNSYYDLIAEKEFTEDFEIFVPFEYQSYPFKPVAVVNISYFCDICKEYLRSEYDSIPVYVYANTVALVFKTDSNKSSTIRLFGENIDINQTPQWKCAISTQILYKLSKIEKLCPNGNVRIYMELKNKQISLPMRITLSIGDMGVVDFYLKTKLINDK